MKKLFFVLLIISGVIFSQRPNLSGLKFCIDPGHGGNNAANDRHVVPDPGTDFWESESNFQKALLLKPIMEAKGAWVMLTRYTNNYPNDDEPSLSARSTMANQNNVHWFHSIHSNAYNGQTNYTLLLLKEDIPTRKAAFPQADTMSQKIAKQIQNKLRTSANYVRLDYTFYGGPPNGYNLGVLKGLLMPGQLSEGSFHDYFPETRRLMNNHYRKMEAYAIYNGFLEYYKVPYDSIAIIAGVLKDTDILKLINYSQVRIMPDNKIYNGDKYNNGFYMFDSLTAGTKTIYFETTGYVKDSLVQVVNATGTYFVDRNLVPINAPKIQYSLPKDKDSLFSVTGQIGIIFTRSMDTATIRQAFSLTPFVDGSLTFTNQNKTTVFTPTTNFLPLTNYVLKIDSTAKSSYGIPIDGNGDGTPGDPYIVNFKTGQVTSVEKGNEKEYSFKLNQNYPNPFNPKTIINYQLQNNNLVTLKIYNVIGKEIETLVNKQQTAGKYTVEWNANDYPSGIYFYELRAGNFRDIKKMILMK